jgi:hypothetical protein
MNASRCLTTHLNIFTRKTGGLIAMSRVTSAPLGELCEMCGGFGERSPYTFDTLSLLCGRFPLSERSNC